VSSTEESSNLAVSIFKKIDKKKRQNRDIFYPPALAFFYSAANQLTLEKNISLQL
jgi:hypothetical protein